MVSQKCHSCNVFYQSVCLNVQQDIHSSKILFHKSHIWTVSRQNVRTDEWQRGPCQEILLHRHYILKATHHCDDIQNSLLRNSFCLQCSMLQHCNHTTITLLVYPMRAIPNNSFLHLIGHFVPPPKKLVPHSKTVFFLSTSVYFPNTGIPRRYCSVDSRSLQ